MGNTSLNEPGKNDEFSWKVKEERKFIHTVKRRNANWIGHILCRNWLIIDWKTHGRIEVSEGRGRRCKQLMDDLEEMRG